MTLCDENWCYKIDINYRKQNCDQFDSNKSAIIEQIIKLIKGFTVQSHMCYEETDDNNKKLESLVEKNKQIQSDIDMKIKKLSLDQEDYGNLRRDCKVLSQETKELHEAFLMAKKYYKKFLKMYYTIESRNEEIQTVYLQFFVETKKDSDNYSVRLQRDLKSGSYEIMETKPPIRVFKDVQRKLQETKYLPGALCCIRDIFIEIKRKK